MKPRSFQLLGPNLLLAGVLSTSVISVMAQGQRREAVTNDPPATPLPPPHPPTRASRPNNPNEATSRLFESFSTDIFTTGAWSRTDASVSVNIPHSWMHITADGGYDDYASKTITLTLPFTIETRLCFISGGGSYPLPTLDFYYDLGAAPFDLGYSNNSAGWLIGDFTYVNTHGPAAKNAWTTVRAVISQDGGKLYVIFDGEPDFTFVLTNIFTDVLAALTLRNYDSSRRLPPNIFVPVAVKVVPDYDSHFPFDVLYR